MDKPFKLNYEHDLMEEHFNQLVEEKYAYGNQEKLKIGRKIYASLRNTYYLLSSCGIWQK